MTENYFTNMYYLFKMYEYNGSRFYDLFPDNEKWEFTQPELEVIVVEIYSLKSERN